MPDAAPVISAVLPALKTVGDAMLDRLELIQIMNEETEEARENNFDDPAVATDRPISIGDRLLGHFPPHFIALTPPLILE